MRNRLSVIKDLAVCLAVMLILSGCVSKKENQEKIREPSFTVTDKLKVPDELQTRIEEEKASPFRLTYCDQGILYIARGYGVKEKSGYSVEVTELYETEESVVIHTKLMGPEKGEKTKEAATWPYVVVQMEDLGKDVVFQ